MGKYTPFSCQVANIQSYIAKRADTQSYTATGTSTDPSNTRFWKTVNERLKNNGSNDGEVVIGNKRFVFTRAGIF